MSQRNGDRARFQKNRKRKLLHRQRIWALMARLREKADGNNAPLAEQLLVAPKTAAVTV